MRYKIHKGHKYTKLSEMEEVINKYFDETDEEMVTISGLCLALGIQKSTLYHYATIEPFKDLVNMARLAIEHSYELSLRKNGRTGDIFALKNFGWTDKAEGEDSSQQDLSVTVKVVPASEDDMQRLKKLKEGLFKDDN